MRQQMQRHAVLPIVLAAVLASTCGGNSSTSPSPSQTSTLSFFVTSQTSVTGNLGGLRGADALCQSLASAVGAGSKTWRAYLSVERDADNGNNPTNARSRIGNGPWVNAAGVTVAANLTELHARKGDAAVFVDERGQRINGQWSGSPAPVQHDILTGSAADGTLLVGLTCSDWTSTSTTVAAQVGHSDGFGPNQDTSGALSSWNSAHANASCADTAPRGGSGRIYCFAR
jgi:FlaG/FlaF family flagellin (archaellin)